MLFNSVPFLFFLPVVLTLLWLLRRTRNPRLLMLVAASFVFYGWWDAKYLVLILASGLIDFFCAQWIGSGEQRRKRFLVLSILGNLGILATFKYSRFFAQSLESFLRLYDVDVQLVAQIPADVVLPVGISFYTFQSMSYTIDVYRGKLAPTRNPLLFFGYISLFPQLVAGPIVRATTLLPQLEKPPRVSSIAAWEGLRWVVQGYFKKTVIADNLAPYVDRVFGTHHSLVTPTDWWLGVAMFALQIYADFSGYTDIARGLGRWMGCDFPKNFDRPYAATSLQDFWGRWHISLSTWFRDYVYIPLGGSQCTALRNHYNLWLTMILSGLWHGAAWPFVIWGAWHAAVLSAERITGLHRRFTGPIGLCFRRAVTLFAVFIGWAIFRAESLAQVRDAFMGMAFLRDPPTAGVLIDMSWLTYAILIGFVLMQFVHGIAGRLAEATRERILHWLEPPLFVALVLAAIFLRGPGQQFIYFQF